MSLIIPPAKNYKNPTVALVARYQNPPREGNRMVPMEILWGDYSPNYCVAVNLQNNATLEFSQVVALSVDNSDCGADVRFVFPDTGETTTIPAYSPKTIIEVFTNQVQFNIVAGFDNEIVLSGDTTRFSIHNSLPPPIAVPTTQEQNTISANNLPADGSTTNTILASTVNGTLEGLQVFRCSPFANLGTQMFVIQDGTGKVIAKGQFDTNNASNWFDGILIDLNPMSVRFSGGLTQHQSGTNVGGSYVITALYRTP